VRLTWLGYRSIGNVSVNLLVGGRSTSAIFVLRRIALAA